MVGDSFTTVINIVNYISLNGYHCQSRKSRVLFLDSAVGVVVYSSCPSPFKKATDQRNTDCIFFI